VRLLLPQARELDWPDLLDLYGADDHGLLRAGFVLSADGGAAVGGGSRGLQSPADQAVFAALRAVSDAVVVGAGTARSEGYRPVRVRPEGRQWRAAHGRADLPVLVLVSRSLELDPADACFTGPTVVITCAAADPGRRAALEQVADVVVSGGDDVDLPGAVAALRGRGLRRLLCEGGPMLLTALLTAELVDELCLTTAPVLLGTAPTLLAQALPDPVDLRLVHLVDGEDGSLLTRWSVSAGRAAPACST
jgi:riboflavin biosynthesis pyrimidine reductase